ncbi:DUF423 domain-containing protein [Aureimonas glaciei]|uniref:DUF423 domain-containing protein n=1 Tax=Aureimonas glaciei TaxID=1776957 RepID=A0A916Y1H8_9HYPH|nr:DUF423 domain-containing protein [Aureimonas glaciei]GGD27157.1 hypothetical protein GCM10011335_32750 [Aureimonas glaciei]
MAGDFRPAVLMAAGLLGALGVGGAALAAHGGDNRLIAIAAAIALVHAPCLIALAAVPAENLRLAMPAALLMVVGTLLFSGDLAARTFLGDRLFANAAPAGGMILIGGWLLVAIGAGLAVLRRRRHEKLHAREGIHGI